ncbi:MAG TPA: MCE family protein [Acidimicrobiales bacterium]|jgi:phospholipid/cholesterol/gamma-HCH transport system substrate-binding protein
MRVGRWARGGVHRRAAVLVVGALAAALVGTGCGLSFQALPKPGGVSGPSYNLTAVFGNVLNLPVQARVLIGADQVGEVSSISTSHFKADLTLTIRRAIRIPKGTTAQILFVDPLGDEFIQLFPPRGQPHGPYLTNDSVVPERDTSSAPSIADTLAALGALLNGGGLSQLETIVTNLNEALGGHQQQIRRIIDDLSFTVTALNANKSSVDNALASLAALSTQLAKGDAAIASGIDSIGPAVAVLSSENQDFENLLTATNNLSNVADSIVTQSSSSILGTIKQLDAVISQMVAVSSQLGPTLTDLAKFESQTKQIAPGNYLQLSLDGTAIVSQTPLLGPNSASPSSSSASGASAASGASGSASSASSGSNPTTQAINGLLGAGLP